MLQEDEQFCVEHSAPIPKELLHRMTRAQVLSKSANPVGVSSRALTHGGVGGTSLGYRRQTGGKGPRGRRNPFSAILHELHE